MEIYKVVVLDKTKMLDHETVFFFASEMGYRLNYVMEQAGIPYVSMPAGRLHENSKFQTIPIPQTVISDYNVESTLVRAMISKMNPEYMAEKMKEIIADEDLRRIDDEETTFLF